MAAKKLLTTNAEIFDPAGEIPETAAATSSSRTARQTRPWRPRTKLSAKKPMMQAAVTASEACQRSRTKAPPASSASPPAIGSMSVGSATSDGSAETLGALSALGKLSAVSMSPAAGELSALGKLSAVSMSPAPAVSVSSGACSSGACSSGACSSGTSSNGASSIGANSTVGA